MIYEMMCEHPWMIVIALLYFTLNTIFAISCYKNLDRRTFFLAILVGWPMLIGYPIWTFYIKPMFNRKSPSK